MCKLLPLLILTLCLITIPSLPALDFGLVWNQNLQYYETGSETVLDYEGIVIPRLTGIWGSTGAFHVSLGLNYENDPWAFVPELLTADIYMRGSNLELRLGRMFYIDPLGFIAGGLFDGGRVSFDMQAGTFSAGAWYTGLVYKKRLNIEMTGEELEHNDAGLDYGDFRNTYFAPRRLLAALDWEHHGLGSRNRVAARAAIFGQFDFSGAGLHTQYLSAKLTAPITGLIFNLGACLELIQNAGGFNTGFAAELSTAWQNPTHRLELLSRFSTAEFLPISSIAQSNVLSPKLSGVSFISLDYTARFHRVLSASISSFYFMRSNAESFPFYNPNGRFLGAEVYGGLYWSPLSDLSLNVAGGIFLPSLGDIAPDARNLWRIDVNLILSLY